MRVAIPALALGWLMCCSGCGGRSDRPAIATVEGTVTLDGRPLANANVWFDPLGGGRTSTAVTDSSGRFELLYTLGEKGAIIGEHDVRISTFVQGGDEPGSAATVPERVPSKYAAPSAIRKQVSAGKNTIDVELDSK
jgi:hypothetical protein